MSTSSEKIFRRFLLGLANEEEECRVEEAILTGEVDAVFLHNLEDELIDDYILGSITREERQGFDAHFLAVDQRKERVAFATALVEYARKQPAEKPSAEPKFVPRSNILTAMFWKRTALLATAAALLLAVLVGIKQIQLRQQKQIASSAQNELTHLHALLTAENSGTSESDTLASVTQGSPLAGPDSMLTIEIGSSVRGINGIKAKELQVPVQAQFVRIDLKLPSPLADRYRETVLSPSDKPILIQEFPSSVLPATHESAIFLPISSLERGIYHLQIEQASANGPFKFLANPTIRIER